MVENLRNYGYVYKEKMFPALSEILLVSDPVDVEKLLSADGKWPNRPEGFGVLEKIREKAGIPLGVLMA